MRLFAVTLAALIIGFSLPLQARDDIMPPPKPAPRIPVERETLYENENLKFAASGSMKEPVRVTAKASPKVMPKETAQESKEVEGAAQAVDGERLNVEGTEIRLFGIVTPSLSSNYGPQARQNLEEMLVGTVLCKLTDKDREGRPVAFCGTVEVPDISYEMLRQGWAMADRRGLKDNALSEIYAKAESEAQSANRGIFAPTPMATVIPLTNPGKSITIADSAVAQDGDGIERTEDKPVAVATAAPAPSKTPAMAIDSGFLFVERYQTLLAAGLLLLAAMIYASASVMREKARVRETRRAVAAALRGELMAARHIFRTKSRDLIYAKAESGKNALRPSQLWPRIRTAVYQANITSIGLLGSELARRVASVYGQCTDYAMYFQQAQASRLPAPRAVAETLSVLAKHMEVVLEGLAQVEGSGRSYTPPATVVEVPTQLDDEEKTETETAASKQKKSFVTMAKALFLLHKVKKQEAEPDEDDSAEYEEAEGDEEEQGEGAEEQKAA
jgi:endonuclease YncB( thermonuclease family)